jgi:hypothetical protein
MVLHEDTQLVDVPNACVDGMCHKHSTFVLDIADQSPFSIATIGVEWCKAQGIHLFPQFSLPRNAFEAVSPVFPQTVTFPLHPMCRSGSDECPMRRDKEYRMLNNIYSLSIRPPIVNVNCTISARARPLIGGCRSQFRHAMQGEWVRVATGTPGRLIPSGDGRTR